MPDKLTDREIVKALEEWRKEIVADYQRLQLLDAPMDCFESHVDNIRVLSNALDLINRLQAENEAKQNRFLELLNLTHKYRDKLLTAKAEAVKEVFEKLNDKSIRSKAKVKGCGFLYVSVVTLHDINNLKKETVG